MGRRLDVTHVGPVDVDHRQMERRASGKVPIHLEYLTNQVGFTLVAVRILIRDPDQEIPVMTKSCTTLDINAFESTRAAVQADPAAGRGSFQATTVWEDGARARTVARSFTIETDEPAPLGGTDQAVDPMELLLASVGTCLTIGWVTNAVRRGVDFRDLRIDVTGDYDLRGYLGIDGTRPGFGAVSYTVHVDTDADEATLEEIRKAAEAGSPMVDNTANPTPLTGVVQRAS